MSEVGIQTELVAIRELLERVVGMMAQSEPHWGLSHPELEAPVPAAVVVKRKPGRPARKK